MNRLINEGAWRKKRHMKCHCDWCKRLITGREVYYKVDYIFPPRGSAVLCRQCYEMELKSKRTYDELVQKEGDRND